MSVRDSLRAAAPALTVKLDRLVQNWTNQLVARLANNNGTQFRAKQINDPIWGMIELYPWEVALLDTDLLQRMRGVRQLGLAPLVFPSACHDRLEHILGTVGAVERTLAALALQIERRNRDVPSNPVPPIKPDDRYALRLAALFHDLGHGPFSHAIEPVFDQSSVLRNDTAVPTPEEDWRGDLTRIRSKLLTFCAYNAEPSVSEILAAMIVLSEPVTSILNNRAFGLPGEIDVNQLQERIVAAITGAVDGPGADHLSAVISSQLDADKLDYLQRDAHHAGLEIGFDTDRLLSRLEVLQVRDENIDISVADLRKRVSAAPHGTLLQLGIAASGFGSFEQMLLGRTFLYDRLYHHHKVRAAEAMAQRLILVAERDRQERFALEDLFVNLGDDTVLRLFAGQVSHESFFTSGSSAKALAKGILSRDLLHRAFALRGRFIGVAPDLDQEAIDRRRRTLWGKVVADLKSLRARYDLGARIHALAVTCTEALIEQEVDQAHMTEFRDRLKDCGPEQVIVDLPSLKAAAITILARYPNGALRVPEFSFNPVKWSHAYELQKRTSYVFCPRDVVSIIALAAKIEFLSRYGIVLAKEADGFIKADRAITDQWIEGLERAGLIDATAKEHLTLNRISLISIAEADLGVPQEWLYIDEDFGVLLARKLNTAIAGGISAEQLDEIRVIMPVLWRAVDEWHRSGKVTSSVANEAELQEWIGGILSGGGIKVTEGAEAGGGESDLILNDALILENKHEGVVSQPADAKAAAGMQGRRYAIALNKQIVLVALAYDINGGIVPDKVSQISVHSITDRDRRAELRISLPYNAPVPSREKADKSARDK